MTSSAPLDWPAISLEHLMASPQQVQPQIQAALSQVGCFVLRAPAGSTTVDAAFSHWRQFVDLPSEVKMRHHHSVSDGDRHGGWINLREAPVYMSHMDEREKNRVDPKQQFGCDVSLEHTLWPENSTSAGFSDAVQTCAQWLDRLSRQLMSAFALTFEQSADFLRYEPGYLTLSYYPEDASPTNPSIGLHEHSDADLYTLLTQRTAALEIKDRTGCWRSAPTLSGDDLLVLPGDWTELWSNGAFPAVRHRVRDVENKRVSLAFFQNVCEMSIGPLENFIRDDGVLYPTVRSDIEYAQGDSGVPRWKTATPELGAK